MNRRWVIVSLIALTAASTGYFAASAIAADEDILLAESGKIFYVPSQMTYDSVLRLSQACDCVLIRL